MPLRAFIICSITHIDSNSFSSTEKSKLHGNALAIRSFRGAANARFQPRQISLKLRNRGVSLANNGKESALNGALRFGDGIVHPRTLPARGDKLRVAEHGKVFADFCLRQFRYRFQIADANIGIMKDKRKQPQPCGVAESGSEHSRSVEARMTYAIHGFFFSGFHWLYNADGPNVTEKSQNPILFPRIIPLLQKKKPLHVDYAV